MLFGNPDENFTNHISGLFYNFLNGKYCICLFVFIVLLKKLAM